MAKATIAENAPGAGTPSKFGANPEDLSPAELRTAISGYDLRHRIEALVAGITKKNLKHVYKGSGAATGPGIMLLPAIPQTKLFTRRQVEIILGYTAHEISHQLETDFTILAGVFSNPDKPSKREMQLKQWWNAIEDYRIEKVTRREFSGFPIFIGAVRDYTAQRFVGACEQGLVDPSKLGNPYAIGAVGLTWVGAILNGYPTAANRQALSFLSPELSQWLQSLATRLAKVETPADALDLAREILDELESAQAEDQSDDQDQGDDDSQDQDQDQQGQAQNTPEQDGASDEEDASSSQAADPGSSGQEDQSQEQDNEEENSSSNAGADGSQEDEASEDPSTEESDEDGSGSDRDADRSSAEDSDDGDSTGQGDGDENDDASNDAGDDNSSDEDGAKSDGSEGEDNDSIDAGDRDDQQSDASSSSGEETSGDDSDGEEDGSSAVSGDDADDGSSPEDDADAGGETGSGQDHENNPKESSKSSRGSSSNAPTPQTTKEDREEDAEESDLNIDEIMEALDQIATAMDHVMPDIDQSVEASDHQKVQRAQRQYSEIKSNLGSAAARAAGTVRRLLASQDKTRTRRNLEEGRLDMSRLVPIVNGRNDVYCEKNRKKDVNSAVSILVDNSGSMGGNPLEVCQKASIILDHAVCGSGSDLEITGYTGNVSRPVIYEYRRFGQKGQSSAATLGNMTDVELGGTPTSVPLLEAQRRLHAHKAPRKIMIIISDGMADDAARSKEAHDLAVAQGTQVIGIGIGEYGGAIAAWCTNAQVIREIDDLPQALTVVVQQALLPSMRQAA